MTDIIKQIDGTLDDYEVSPDAMRWSPTPDEHDGTRPNKVWWTADSDGFEIDTEACRFLRCSSQ